MKQISRLAKGLPEPVDYFAGKGGEPWCWPLNLIAFSRKTRRDLQRRTFESRLHTRYVLIVNLATAGTLNLDSTPYRLVPGQAHLVFPHQLHTYHDVDHEDILWLFVTFELPDGTPLRTLRAATVALDAETMELLALFLDAYRKSDAAPHRLQTILSQVLLRLIRPASHTITPLAPEPREQGKFLEAVHRHHTRRLPDALSVGELASLMKMSESRLRTRFRETFGLSVGAYLRNLRLQEAVAMMRHSEDSLTNIALSCAFGSSSAFSRAFKHWAGVAPRTFRTAVTTPSRQRTSRQEALC